MYPADLRYDREHEWVRLDGDVATIGITDYAQDQLGEVVYVDLPSVGDEVVAGDSFGEIESVKSVSELFSPVSGEIVEVNDALADAPELVNSSPYEDGWMIKVRVADPAIALDGLMTADEYESFIAEEA
ncbi:glycine cleavage system protein GcvH [Coriobacteriia bacterium Es71-Z0120]|uniref:glycine cleavage system protein GcvH n=1 Tax=Parvivirga hydrogeniphila TaxID=2939460 RepID=UPI002260A74E|nr:glycine cleavage system protein GcvH [Parvivirga hydrogeniphila]MCL4079666.1 glycine cleavage system protein GcvH [Parvivirga hydrogeniphila]